MDRVVVLGRGGAGKTVLARRLGATIGVPVVELDFALVRCAYRAVRRGRERSEFWRWVLGYRRRLPRVLDAVDRHAPQATLVVLRTPREAERWLRRT